MSNRGSASTHTPDAERPAVIGSGTAIVTNLVTA
jgi:hypothetical protein